MTSGGMSEAGWEALATDALGELGWEPVEGKLIAPGSGERESWDQLIIPGRLQGAIERINPQLPQEAVDEVIALVLTPASRDVLAENRRLHEYLTRASAASSTPTIRSGAEPDDPAHRPRDPYNNDFLAANQVTVIDGDHSRRLDIVAYVNGLPLGVIELKKAGDENEDLDGRSRPAHDLRRGAATGVSLQCRARSADGITARYGTAFTPFEHFAPWN